MGRKAERILFLRIERKNGEGNKLRRYSEGAALDVVRSYVANQGRA